MSEPTTLHHAVITSFGYRHLSEGVPVMDLADITVDVREHLHDPHVDPGLRELTGEHGVVVARVLDTPGAERLIQGLARALEALLPAASRAGRVVTLAVGCSGGRHRSVAIAEAIATQLDRAGWVVDVDHLHLGMPVLPAKEASDV